MRFVLGIDIGGTKVGVGCVAVDGSTLRALASAPTHAEAGASDVLDRIVALAQRCIAQTRQELPGVDILGVGVGAPVCGQHAEVVEGDGAAGPVAQAVEGFERAAVVRFRRR